jgi:transcriptional regulator with XRE-family HTH domain
MASIGSAIKRLRHRKGYSQQKIQELTRGEVKAAWIASLETDRLELLSQKQVEKLQSIADVLGVTVLDIYHEAGLVELPHPSGASREERQMLNEFRRLPPEIRQVALVILRDLRRIADAEMMPAPVRTRRNPPVEEPASTGGGPDHSAGD